MITMENGIWIQAYICDSPLSSGLSEEAYIVWTNETLRRTGLVMRIKIQPTKFTFHSAHTMACASDRGCNNKTLEVSLIARMER